jgi:thymidylate kinase
MIMNRDGNEVHPNRAKSDVLIGVVGVCASGKSTLIEGLSARGYKARHIAQEHSYVKDMWRRITNPDILIFLDTTFEKACNRRKMDWTYEDFLEQQRRVSHARENSDFYLETSTLQANEVLERVIQFLEKAIS